MRFSEAMEKCMTCKYVMRNRGWNGQNAYVYYVPYHRIPIEQYRCKGTAEDPTSAELLKGYVEVEPHFDMVTTRGKRHIGWLVSQLDLSSEEWQIGKFIKGVGIEWQ